jgi:hypothetical protein
MFSGKTPEKGAYLYFLAQRSGKYNIRDFWGKEKVSHFTKIMIFVILDKIR